MDASHKPAIYLRSALVYYCANAFILVKSKLVIVNRQTVEPSYVYVYVERRRFGVQSVLGDRLVEGGEGGGGGGVGGRNGWRRLGRVHVVTGELGMYL